MIQARVSKELRDDTNRFSHLDCPAPLALCPKAVIRLISGISQ